MESRHTAIAGTASAVVLLVAGLLLSHTALARASAPDRQPVPTPTPLMLPADMAWLPGGMQSLSCSEPRRVAAPVVEPAWDNNSRTLQLCLYGFRENTNVAVSAQNASGATFSATFPVSPPIRATDEQGAYTFTVAEADLLWPGAVPGGAWRVTVAEDGPVYSELHEVPPATPDVIKQISFTPLGFQDPLRVSIPRVFSCQVTYIYHPGEHMAISGKSYLPNADAELGLYGVAEPGVTQSAPQRISHRKIRTDSQGSFTLDDYMIPADTAPGLYWLAALTEAASSLTVIDSRTRCFKVDAPAAAAPAAASAAAPAATPAAAPAAPSDGADEAAGAVVLRSANLRAGPGTSFARVGRARAGTELVVVGMNEDGTWYQLDTGAWIAAFLVRLAR